MKQKLLFSSILILILLLSFNAQAACPCDCDDDGKLRTVDGCDSDPDYDPSDYDCDDDGDGFFQWNAGLCEYPPEITDVDENDPNCCDLRYIDSEGDGHGDPATATCACGPIPSGYVTLGDDCDDSDGWKYPGAVDICDGVDNNCLGDLGYGSTDEGCDDDGDGYCDANMYYLPGAACIRGGVDCPTCGDCNDDPWSTQNVVFGCDTSSPPNDDCTAETQCSECVNPGVPEVCDYVDNDCDGTVDEDCLIPALITVTNETGDVIVDAEETACTLTYPGSGYALKTCYYPVDLIPGAKRQHTYEIKITWTFPTLRDLVYFLVVDHDASKSTCDCFFKTECGGDSCWLASQTDTDSGNVQPKCCGDDEKEHYISSSDGTEGCCDNMNSIASPPIMLTEDECVINRICQNRIPTEESVRTARLLVGSSCNTKDDDCDGEVDEFCKCDDAKVICDTKPGCPEFKCLNEYGIATESCWGLGGDAPNATRCCENGKTDENYVWNAARGVDACCDNKDAGGNPLPGTECVYPGSGGRGVCMNWVVSAEACDGIDNDCDGMIDEDFDNDGDFVIDYAACGLYPPPGPSDCDDSDPQVHPGAPEICDDWIDQNCDGEDMECGSQQDVVYWNLCRLVYDLLYLLMYLVFGITILLIAIGAIKLIGEADDPEASAAAKSMIRNAFIGLIAVLLLLGVSEELAPECTPELGSAYLPPLRFQEYPMPVVNITTPTDSQFFTVGEPVSYSFYITGGIAPYTYILNYGDQTLTEAGTIPSAGTFNVGIPHVYERAGEYKVTVHIVDSEGEEAWDSVKILVGKMYVKIEEPKNNKWTLSTQPIDFKATVLGGREDLTFKWFVDSSQTPIEEATVTAHEYSWTAPATDSGSPKSIPLGEHVIKVVVIDVNGLEAFDLITIYVTPPNPTIKNVESCWSGSWLYPLGASALTFDVEADKAALNNVIISAMTMKSECLGWPLPCRPMMSNEEIYCDLAVTQIPYNGNVPFYHDKFYTQISRFEIEVRADEGTWKYCVECDAKPEDEEPQCPTIGLKACRGYPDGTAGDGIAQLGACPRDYTVCCSDGATCITVPEDEIDLDRVVRYCEEDPFTNTVGPCYYMSSDC